MSTQPVRVHKPDAYEILRTAGPTLSITQAAVVLGLSDRTAYELARQGRFPVRVLRVGQQYRVPGADLRRLLGLPVEPVTDVAGVAAEAAAS